MQLSIIKINILAALLAILMFTFGMPAHAADATSAPPPGVSMSSGGGVPVPPVCNATYHKLYWNGSGWQCIGVGNANYANSSGTASSVTGYAKGGIAGGVRTATGYSYSMSMPCPGGFYAIVLSSSTQFNYTTNRYICAKS